MLGGWLAGWNSGIQAPQRRARKGDTAHPQPGSGSKNQHCLWVRTSLCKTSRRQGYKATYLAVGCQKGASLAIPGEDTDGVIQGVDFLREAALGKPIDGIKKAVVIGGGNVAIDAARTLVVSERCHDSLPPVQRRNARV